MTATRDRRSDPDLDAELAWDERPIIGTFRGVPWWAAVVLGFGVAAVAAFIDMQRADTLGQIYQIGYLVGCVSAVCLVRRHSLFGPMVQPPLVFAVTAIGAYVFLGRPTNGGLKQLFFSVAIPLTSNFLTMATATAIAVAIGAFRLWRERDPNPTVRPSRPQRDRHPDDDVHPDTGSRGERERPRRDRTTAPPRQPRSRDTAADDEQPPPRRTPRAPRGENRQDRTPRDRGTPRGSDPRPDRASRDRQQDPRRRERDPRGDRDRPRAGEDRRENPRGGSQPRPRRRPPEDPYR